MHCYCCYVVRCVHAACPLKGGRVQLGRVEIAEWEGSEFRGADKSLARPGRKQANVSVRMA